MQATLEANRELALKRQTNILMRGLKYLRAKPIRFVFAGFVVYMANRYTWMKKMVDWRASQYASYRARWMRFYNNPAYRYETVDAFSIGKVAKNNNLSEAKVDELAKLMLELETKAKRGFSTELVLTVL